MNNTDIRGEESTHEARRPVPSTLLIVGTLGGGGVHHYVVEQANRLSDRLSVSIYDMVTPPTGTGLIWFLTSVIRSLWAAVKFPFRRPPDIVHVHSSHRFSFYRASFYVLFAAHIWKRPVFLHIHGSSFDEFVGANSIIVRLLQSVVFDATNRVIVLSEYWREVLSSEIPKRKIRVLPNAVDPTEYDPSFGSDPPHIVFVSNLIPRKGVRELIEALEMLIDRSIPFRATIAGNGRFAAKIEELANRYESIEYAGFVSESRKREILNAGAIFVLPTHAEGLPIAMLEGMAGGNAIISTPVGSIPEVISEENGYLVEPGSGTALADALEEAIDSLDETERMARRNRTLIEERYGWDRMTKHLVQLYVNEFQKVATTTR